MRRRLLALLVLCTVLAGLSAVLGSRSAPAGERGLVRLAAAVAGQGRTVSAVSVEVPGRDVRWLFARSKGRWRAREASGAFLDEELFQAWLADLLDARGLAVSADPARGGEPAFSAKYGLAPGALVRIGLHGPKVLDAPDRDALAAFELGRTADGRTFGRIAGGGGAGELELLELDRRLLDPLGALEPGSLPRFVDTHLLAGSLEPGVLGFRRIAFERRDGARFELRCDAPASGASGTEAPWTITARGAEAPAIGWRAGGLLGLLLRGRGLGFASPQDAATLGLDDPFVRIELEQENGATIELRLSDKTLANEAWLWNRATNLVVRIGGAMHAELSPEPEDFTDPGRANPWERYLQNLGPTERR